MCCEEALTRLEKKSKEFISGRDLSECGTPDSKPSKRWDPACVVVERRGCEGAWQWLSRVIFDQPRTATGHVGPGRAATFPLRRGDLEGVSQIAEDAWALLALHSTNGLAGPVRPLACGKWTALGRRAADTARCYVQRLLKRTGGSVSSFEKIGWGRDRYL